MAVWALSDVHLAYTVATATARRNRVMTVGFIRMPDATSCRRCLALHYGLCGNRRRADGVVNVETLPQLGRGAVVSQFQPLASLMRNQKEVRYLVTPANYLWSLASVAGFVGTLEGTPGPGPGRAAGPTSR